MTTPEQRAAHTLIQLGFGERSNPHLYDAITRAIREAESDARADERKRIETEMMEAVVEPEMTVRDVCELIREKIRSNPR